jgi:hypothetical protein
VLHRGDAVDIPATLVMIIVGAGLVAWMTSTRTGHALDAWGSGFIGYRGPGWPRGVQEEEPVHFSFAEPTDPDASDPLDLEAGPEIVELPDVTEPGIALRRIR